MANPVLVEALRGSLVESRHRGAVSVMDADGRQVLEIGDVEQPVFPRSAVKAIQALPLVESGAADAFGFGDREIALACASHSGEPAHTELALSMLAWAGLCEDDYACGSQWPTNSEATIALARAGGSPTQAHNNCSGKHAGFLCTCVHEGIDHGGYTTHGHKLQELVREAMESVTGAAHAVDHCATDGCSIPTYAVPLKSLARGFARMATGTDLPRRRAEAAKRILSACMAEPFYVAGTGRADTAMMEAGRGRLFTKVGAEGVFCAAIPEMGMGIALKCDDGATRAAEVMIAAVVRKLLARDDPLRAALAPMARPALKNWRGTEVGELRPAEKL